MPSSSKKQHNFMAAVANNPKFAKKADVPQSVGEDFVAADKVKASRARPDLQGVNKLKTDHGSMSLFNKGGAMKSDMKQDKAMVKKAVGMHDKQMHGGKKTDMDKLKKGGMPMVMKDGKKIPAFAAKKGGMTKMAMGGAMPAPMAKPARMSMSPVQKFTGPPIIKTAKNFEGLTPGGRPIVNPINNPAVQKFTGPMSKGPRFDKPPKPLTTPTSNPNVLKFNGPMVQSKLKAGGTTKMAKGGGIESKGKTKGAMVRMKSGGRSC